jgi:hypothetical protein
MWKRLRRKSMAPRRPAVFPEQMGLVLLSLLAIGGGIAVVVWVMVA